MKKQLNEIKRMQQLAGMLKEEDSIENDIEQDLILGEFESNDAKIDYLQDIINFCQQKIDELEQEDRSRASSNDIEGIDVYDEFNQR